MFRKEMEDNVKEIERELRENIDLLQNQIREVKNSYFSFGKQFFLF